MPEGLEAEIWRRAVEPLVGRLISRAWVDERVADDQLPDALIGCRIKAVLRRGKVLLIETDGPTLGVHFGMTGRIVVDDVAPIDRLEYASGADRPEWDRLRVFTDGHKQASVGAGEALAIRMNDPRRLGRVSIDPDSSDLGIDMFDITATTLQSRCRGRRAIKAVLLDQRVIAGLGNLCADEVLMWAGIAPHRSVAGLDADEFAALTQSIRRRLPVMLRRGGSTMGALHPGLRRNGAPCPLDGTPLRRSTVGGRTAIWCPQHQS